MKKSEARNLENFTSTISHEFRTPLATAISFVEMLFKMISDAAQMKYLNLVSISLNLLLSLVNDVVDLTLIKSNCFREEVKDFNPTEALEFVHSLMSF